MRFFILQPTNLIFFPRNPFRDNALPAIWTFFSLLTLTYKFNEHAKITSEEIQAFYK